MNQTTGERPLSKFKIRLDREFLPGFFIQPLHSPMIMSNFLIAFIDDGDEVSSFCNRRGPATHEDLHIIAVGENPCLLSMGKPGGE